MLPIDRATNFKPNFKMKKIHFTAIVVIASFAAAAAHKQGLDTGYQRASEEAKAREQRAQILRDQALATPATAPQRPSAPRGFRVTAVTHSISETTAK